MDFSRFYGECRRAGFEAAVFAFATILVPMSSLKWHALKFGVWSSMSGGCLLKAG